MSNPQNIALCTLSTEMTSQKAKVLRPACSRTVGSKAPAQIYLLHLPILLIKTLLSYPIHLLHIILADTHHQSLQSYRSPSNLPRN